MPFRQRFQLALEAGFEGVDAETVTYAEEVASIAEAVEATGIVIPSVVNGASLKHGLFSDDPAEVESAEARRLARFLR